jgi:hypothetical protein
MLLLDHNAILRKKVKYAKLFKRNLPDVDKSYVATIGLYRRYFLK